MHRNTPALLLLPLLLLAGCASTPPLPERMQAQDFAWLTGCWLLQDGEGRTTEEQWMKPVPRGMVGASRTVKEGKILNEELMQVRIGDDGQAAFIATLPGQADTAFVLKAYAPAGENGGALAVFENLAHDFPQRVIYGQSRRSALNARIEGTIDGKSKAIHYDYERVDCAGRE